MPDALVDVSTVADRLADPDWAIVDCRHRLTDPDHGESAYREAHVPGAVFAHADRVLSSEPVTDRGRHPLPDPDTLRSRFGALGIDSSTQVVAYDDAGGAIAGRLWWMLHYMGHRKAAVLDGGWPAWIAAGGATRGGEETRPVRTFAGEPRREWLVTIDRVSAARRLVDSREPARYRGETEPIDRVAGHIPHRDRLRSHSGVTRRGDPPRRPGQRLGRCARRRPQPRVGPARAPGPGRTGLLNLAPCLSISTRSSHNAAQRRTAIAVFASTTSTPESATAPVA